MSRVQISKRRSAIQTEVCHVFPRSLQENAGPLWETKACEDNIRMDIGRNTLLKRRLDLGSKWLRIDLTTVMYLLVSVKRELSINFSKKSYHAAK
jgi:hypothetical protein